MSTFESLLLVVLVVGVGGPIWFFAIAIYHGVKTNVRSQHSDRYYAYAGLIELFNRASNGENISGPVWVSTIRELCEYPEYADISIQYLEELNFTGTTKFDDIIKAEIKAAEASLLDIVND